MEMILRSFIFRHLPRANELLNVCLGCANTAFNASYWRPQRVWVLSLKRTRLFRLWNWRWSKSARQCLFATVYCNSQKWRFTGGFVSFSYLFVPVQSSGWGIWTTKPTGKNEWKLDNNHDSAAKTWGSELYVNRKSRESWKLFYASFRRGSLQFFPIRTVHSSVLISCGITRFFTAAELLAICHSCETDYQHENI